MARFEVSGLDVILEGLWDMAESVPQLRDDILNAEADVIEPAIKNSLSVKGLVRAGKLKSSIARKKYKQSIRIGPQGYHHLGLSNGKLGGIQEYGSARRNIKGRYWMKSGVESNLGKAYSAADKVFDAYMKKHNL